MGRAGTAQLCAAHTALSSIFELNSVHSSSGLQNKLHLSNQFLSVPFWVKHLLSPWKYNSSSVQFLHGTLPYLYQIQTLLILHSLSPLANSVTPHLHFSPPNSSVPIIPSTPLPPFLCPFPPCSLTWQGERHSVCRKGMCEFTQAALGSPHHHLGAAEQHTGMLWERSSGDG